MLHSIRFRIVEPRFLFQFFSGIVHFDSYRGLVECLAWQRLGRAFSCVHNSMIRGLNSGLCCTFAPVGQYWTIEVSNGMQYTDGFQRAFLQAYTVPGLDLNDDETSN